MIQINFNQTNYLGEYPDRRKVKICPKCHEIFDPNVDNCPNCDLYLPSFPTSWIRSATNFFLLRRVLEIISIDLNGRFNKDSLTNILIDNNVISVDKTRLDDPVYFRGGPIRRAEEYRVNLLFLGFVIKSGNDYIISIAGNELISSKTYDNYLSVLTKAFMELKIGNEHDTRKTYSAYDNRIFLSSLRIINDLENEKINAYSQNIALAIMAKNESAQYQEALKISTTYDINSINEMWFSKGKEFNRVVNGVIIRWLSEARLINISKVHNLNRLSLTDYGRKILNEYSGVQITEDYQIIKDKILALLNSSIDKQYLRLNLGSEANNRTGANWETIVKKHFESLNFPIQWYRETQDFINIVLPSSVISSLTGGTKFNPDLIVKDPLWLIDPKKDVNMEMHKVIAYDQYANIVKGLSIIVSQKIMKNEKISIMRDQQLKNVIVIDGFALQVISDNKDYFDKQKITNIIDSTRSREYYYLDESKLFTEFIN